MSHLHSQQAIWITLLLLLLLCCTDNETLEELRPNNGRGLKIILAALLAKKAAVLGAGIMAWASGAFRPFSGVSRGINFGIQGNGQGGVQVSAQTQGMKVQELM